MEYRVVFTKQAVKDAKKLDACGLDKKAKELLKIMIKNSYQIPPKYEKLVGDLKWLYSRRINIQHRLVYEVLEEEKMIKVLRMWSHYE
ncbi:Txe/YoeB family addiction module toxin [Clostridium kluyveri]|uniref:Txe/YoeB family addiction module toxin n=1 Tax=Clostridium kluyveri TaxID=1534 RepID=UPI002246AD44|nr:Txe/YoeB family addiction module toxin [Clostridium kluyveri]UZQ50553.1 Txe/YoeB family addiction module toxin [Clostridium kluyveri]